jgi:hypothetical protein
MMTRMRREQLEGNSSLYTLHNYAPSCEYSAICCVTPHPRLFREYLKVVRAMTFHEDVDGERVQEMTRRLSPIVKNLIYHTAILLKCGVEATILIGSRTQAELKRS